MARELHKPEENVPKLRQVDVLTGQGKSIVEAMKTIAVPETTYFPLEAVVRRHEEQAGQTAQFAGAEGMLIRVIVE